MALNVPKITFYNGNEIPVFGLGTWKSYRLFFRKIVSPDRPYAKPNDPRLLDDKRIAAIGKKYNKSPAQILIRYQLDRGHVVFPKSTIKSELIENSQVFDFKLNPEDMEALDAMNCNRRMVPMTECETSLYYPFHIPF